jgi:hypothetical protein
MTIQYFIFEDIEDDTPFVFEPPENNPLDGGDPEAGISQYYKQIFGGAVQ